MTIGVRGVLSGCFLALTLASRVLAQTCSPSIFIEAAAYPAGTTAYRVATGDFTGDGIPDVVTVNSEAISVIPGDGSGGLSSPIVTPFNDNVNAIAAADLRGNGTFDLVVLNYQYVAVMLGRGDGTFDEPVYYNSLIYNLSSVVIAPFDDNSSLDILVAASGSSYPLSLLPGNGDGTFGDPTLSSSGTAVSMAAGDFDGDDLEDVVAAPANQSGYVLFYRGGGDGSFAAPTALVAGPQTGAVAVADFNGDSKLDIAAGSAAWVSVLLGNGSGGFEAALLYDANVPVNSVATGDIDGDGIQDILASATGDFYTINEVSVLRGRGDGSFDDGVPYASGGAIGPLVADLDQNGRDDVIMSGGSIYVLLSDTDGSLRAVPNSVLTGPPNRGFATGDWNGDGLADFTWILDGSVALIEGVGGGRFRLVDRLPRIDESYSAIWVTAGHFFDATTWDIAATVYNGIVVYRGNGDGTFQDPVQVYTYFSLAPPLVALDLDGANHDDLVAMGQSLLTFMNNGDGTFSGPVETPFLANNIQDFVRADLGAPTPLGSDGIPDLLVVSGDAVSVMYGTPSGALIAGQVIGVPYVSQGPFVATADFDGGGQDILVSYGASSVSLYRNAGDGTFGPPSTIALPTSGGAVTAGHYGDEADFVVWTNYGMLLFLGLGNGHFQAPMPLASQISFPYLVTASLSGSGTDDIAALSPAGIAAFRNARLSARVESVSVLTGTPAALDAKASGFGSVTYQWRRDGTPIADGGSISGVHTSRLSIDPATFADAGTYDVIVTDSCASVASNPAVLEVEFADVPTSSPFHNDILAIATAGITGGCGGSDYCPTLPVRRDQMAAFLLKSEHGSAYLPPACTPGVFSDVACPGAFADWIEQLAAEGITGGCGAGIYCPDQSVTRAQMAVFLLKTKEGSAYVPPPATGIFGDVPVGSFAADWIEDLYTRGISGGCSASPLLYCPGNVVLRQQMATFLVRTFVP